MFQMINFWEKLPKNFTVLAPMEDVTDTVFRQIVASAGRPDVFFTEFTNIDGLLSKGVGAVAQRLKFGINEKPIVAQIWGNDPEKFYKTAKILSSLGFSGIDINMGCPQKDVVRKNCGGGCIKMPDLAKEIIIAVKKGAGELPISVKTRLGFKKIETEDWISHLLNQKIDALTIHLRTVVEMSKVPSHFEELEKIIKIKNEQKLKTKIIANGDIKNLNQADLLFDKYKIDGVMIGRGIFENVWVFNRNIDPTKISLSTRKNLLLKHLKLFEKTWGNTKNFATLKKYFKIYTFGIANAGEIREKLMKTNNYEEAEKVILQKESF